MQDIRLKLVRLNTRLVRFNFNFKVKVSDDLTG